MGDLDLSKPIFAASGQQANSWESVSAGAKVDLEGEIQLRRGLDIDLGLSLMANLDASFRQFLAADLQGQAQAQASVRGQIQLPLSLFDEAGLAVRLQAIAELAAGIRVGLGLTFGNFLDLAGADPNVQGVPLKLLTVFLEQVDLEANFYAKAAISAQAYANFVAVGTLIKNSQTGTGPGFTIAAGAGAGLKAGAGFQVSANVGIRDVSQLIGKTVDLLVDDATGRIVDALPTDARQIQGVVRAARMPFKLALRLAFELGEHLALHDPAHSASGQDSASQCALQVVLEEMQRATLEGFLDAVVQEFTAIITVASKGAVAEWTACHPQRYALAAHLRSAPESLFAAEAIPFWTMAATLVVALAAKLAASQPQLRLHATIVWCATQLLDSVTKRIVDSDRTKRDRPLRQVAQAFTGQLPTSPPNEIDAVIRQRLQQSGSPPASALRYEDLVLYLADQAVIQVLAQNNPPVVGLLNKIIGPFAPDLAALVRVILQNASSFPLSAGGQVDPAAALRVFADGISNFVTTQVDAELRQSLHSVFDQQPDLRLIFDEVMIPSVDFTLAVAFQEVAAWANSTTSTKTLTEGLSAVLLRVLGRSLVVTGDILLFEAQRNMVVLLQGAAAEAKRPNGLVEHLASLPGIGVAAGDIGELVIDALEIAADVFGPLPDEKRQHIRGLLYSAIDPFGGRPATQLLQALNDPGLPNFQVMEALATELGNYAIDRFLVFVERLVSRLLEHMADAFLAALDQVAATVTAWVADVQDGIVLAVQRLSELAGEVAAAVAEIGRRLDQAMNAFADVLESFSSATARARFVDYVADAAYSVAAGVLEDNFVYQNFVPGGLKSEIRNTVKSVLRDVLQGSPLDNILALIGEVTNDIDSLIDDARHIPPGSGFAGDLRELVLSRFVALVNGGFGNLSIRVKFQIDIPFVGTETIDLGSIRVPLTGLTGSIRQMIAGVGVFDDAIDTFATELNAMFKAENQKDAATTERAGVAAAHQRLSGLLDVVASDNPRVAIERPVNLQNVGGGSPVQIRLFGFKPGILTTGSDVPQRVNILLNGQAVDLQSFRMTSSVGAAGTPNPKVQANGGMPVRPGSPTVRNTAVLRTPGSLVHPAEHNPLLGSPIGRLAGSSVATTEPFVLLTGTFTVGLITNGLNHLLVDVTVDSTRRYHASAGFYVNDASRSAPSSPAGRKTVPSGPLPKATAPTHDGLGLLMPSSRAIASEKLRVMTSQPIPQHPLHALAEASSKIASIVGIQATNPAGSRPPIHLVAPLT